MEPLEQQGVSLKYEFYPKSIWVRQDCIDTEVKQSYDLPKRCEKFVCALLW